MERLSYLQRLGFDPTDCDNADNYFHPSDPLGPGPSLFGRQHQCPSRPLRPVPTDPFEAFRFLNRLQGLNECEFVERNAFAYLNRPQPSHALRNKHPKPRKVKVEIPDVIELFHGDELPNLYFYNTFHELLKQRPILSWFLGFSIVPGDVPDDSCILPPSALLSRAVDAVVVTADDSTPEELLDQESECIIQEDKQDHLIPEECVSHEHSILVSDVDSNSTICRTKYGFSSDTDRVACSGLYLPRRLSTIIPENISMKGFIRLGVSLIKREMDLVSQSQCVSSIINVVRESVLILPRIK